MYNKCVEFCLRLSTAIKSTADKYTCTRDVRNELLISIWRLQISSQPKSTHFMPSKYSPWLEMQSFSRCIHFLKASRYADLGTVIRYYEWQIQVPVGTGISAQQVMLSISETKRNHMGQGLGNMGGEAKQLLFLS